MDNQTEFLDLGFSVTHILHPKGRKKKKDYTDLRLCIHRVMEYTFPETKICELTKSIQVLYNHKY